MAEYVYGIVRPGPSDRGGAGIAGAPLRLIEGAGAAALVSSVPGHELRLGRDELATHARVLREQLDRGPVLPMRAGVVMSEESEVRARLLDAHARELHDSLERFDGTFQADVRIVYEEEPLMREVVAGDREIAALRAEVRQLPAEAALPQRIRLGELVAGAVERVREADAARLLDLLAPLALATDVAPPAHERVALNASFLLHRERATEFDAALESAAAAQAGRMRFRYVGPLPPHSFVSLAEAA